MASPNPQAEAVRTAITSLSTCTPATVISFKDLVLLKDMRPESQLSTARRPAAKQATTTNARASRATKPTTKKERAAEGASDGLSDKEKAVLATQVVNAILKALAEASKSVPATPARRPPQEGDLSRTASRNALRRSMSAPMSPLHPRTLNRVSTSPVAVQKQAAVASAPAHSTGCLAAVECGRVAFAALRTLQSSGKVKLPEFQLEAGMSSFVGRLIGLGLFEQALKELRILKHRLDSISDPSSKKKGVKSVAQEGTSVSQPIASILEFAKAPLSDQGLSLVITTQLQALRILSAQKKPSSTEAALPFLKTSSKSSPLNLLLHSSNGNTADKGKIARQLENLSQLLLSLAPSIASKDDGVALERRLSVSPATALELQTIGLEARLHWWSLASHRGNVDKDVLTPLSRCLTAYARRARSPGVSYSLCQTTFEKISGLIQGQNLRPLQSSKSPSASLHQLLGSIARDSGHIGEAVNSIENIYLNLSRDEDSAAKCCSVAAQLLSLHLRQPSVYLKIDSLVNEVLEGIQGPLKGDTTELEELLSNVCLVRKAAMTILVKCAGPEEAVSEHHRHLLETFVFQCPRFCLRWLGKPPASKSSTKDFLRYEQRRQLLSKSIHHILDSALVVAKLHIDERRIVWSQLDSVLQDALTLLEYMGEATSSGSFYVKISHFYYLQYNTLRHETEAKDAGPLRALRNSIDCIKYRPSQEKEKAQLIQKLERFAELCKALGRAVEALGALQAIRNYLVEEGVLEGIATALKNQPPSVAWTSNAKALELSRSLAEVAKLEQVAVDWTTDLSEAEQAAVLENSLHVSLLKGAKTSRISLHESHVESLLRIYYPTQFPIRRYRTLLRLLATNLDDEEAVSDIQSQIIATRGLIDNNDLGEDTALKDYLPHYQTLHTSLTGLMTGYPRLQELEDCLSAWAAMAKAHTTEQDLQNVVDNPAEFLHHLQSIADFSRTMGHESILTKVLELSVDIGKLSEAAKDGLDLKQNAALAMQYITIGQQSEADNILRTSRKRIEESGCVSLEATLCFHLSSAEYSIAIGKPGEAETHLEQARVADGAQPRGRLSRSQRKTIIAHAALLQSLTSLEKGDSHHALVAARNSVRILFQEWSKLEKIRECSFVSETSQIDGQQDLEGASRAELEEAHGSSNDTGGISTSSPAFWTLFLPLFRSISFLSSLYAHLGSFQETIYYAEQAHKLACSTGSSIYMARSETWLASLWLRAAKPEKSIPLLDTVKSKLRSSDISIQTASLACDLGALFGELHQAEVETELLDLARSMIDSINTGMPRSAKLEAASLETKMSTLSLNEKPMTTTRKTRAPAQRKPPAKAAALKSVAKTPQAKPSPPENMLLTTLKATIMLQTLSSHVKSKDWASARSMIEEIEGSLEASGGSIAEKVTKAAYLLGHGMDQMAQDAVFSVIQDSTLSFPAVGAPNGDRYGRVSLNKQSPAGKGRAASSSRTRDISKDTKIPTFLETLNEAQECLLEAHSMAAVKGDADELHRISGMLQNAVVLISAACSVKPRLMSHPAFATSIVEMARNMTWRRECKALLLEKSASKSDGLEWPSPATSLDPRRSSLGFGTDTTRFQHDFIDIIPQDWSVVSIALSENKHDLYITKLHAGHTPFVLRLPLERTSSRDADNETFNFQQGRSELLDIIEKANNSCHDARDMTIKGAKSAWWAEREALDDRMKELLQNIEEIWLGGFKGIFSQHQRRAELHSKFQKGFQKILDKHLPSRRQVRGRKTKAASATKVSFDPRILDLFIGLGDVTAAECDFDDALNDLLYFVVDILQFHGERNAYDEIDFDSMVVETFDELHSYHSALKNSAEPKDPAHTILVLDKALHVFPWESLPCMQGQAVSRVPSLACLRRLILEQQRPPTRATEGKEPQTDSQLVLSGHHVAPTSGTYILNPSSDLKTTQATFDKPLSSVLCPEWKRIVGREPSEADFEAALAEKDIVLYFGHGSGAQYIRGRTIRRLDKCRAAVLLMGCSSASLVYNGEFEVHGPAWNYMMAGCPAVVGTLWDVTDKDIDRLAGRLFEEWGLLARGTFVEKPEKGAKGSSSKTAGGRRAKAVVEEESSEEGGEGGASLVEAVARARDACRFKYLTAAAVCVYGIPVYVSKNM